MWSKSQGSTDVRGMGPGLLPSWAWRSSLGVLGMVAAICMHDDKLKENDTEANNGVKPTAYHFP